MGQVLSMSAIQGDAAEPAGSMGQLSSHPAMQGDEAEPAAKKGRQVYPAGSFCALLDEAEQLDDAVLCYRIHELKMALGLAVTTGRETRRATPALDLEVRMRLAKELSAAETAQFLLRGVGDEGSILDKVKGIWRQLEESADTNILVVKGLLDEVLPTTWADCLADRDSGTKAWRSLTADLPPRESMAKREYKRILPANVPAALERARKALELVFPAHELRVSSLRSIVRARRAGDKKERLFSFRQRWHRDYKQSLSSGLGDPYEPFAVVVSTGSQHSRLHIGERHHVYDISSRDAVLFAGKMPHAGGGYPLADTVVIWTRGHLYGSCRVGVGTVANGDGQDLSLETAAELKISLKLGEEDSYKIKVT